MKLIDGYLSKNILYPTIAIISILSVIILITQSLKYVDLIVSYGTNSLDFLYVTMLLLPSLLFIIIPICLFIAIIYSLNKLNSHRELNILKGVGLSNLSIAKPIIKIAILVAIFHYFLSLVILPSINHQFKEFTKDLKENYVVFFLQEKVFNHPTKFLTFYIKNKISDTKFEGIFYHDTSKKNPVTLVAEKGELIKQDGKLFLNLIAGNRQELSDKGELSVLNFDTLLVQLDFNKNSNSARELAMQEKSLVQLLFPKKDVDKFLKTRMIAEASNRMTWPLYNITLSMLAVAVFLLGEFSRSGKTKRMIYFSSIAGIIVIIHNSLINLSATYPYVIILSYAFTFAILGGLIYILFYKELQDFRKSS